MESDVIGVGVIGTGYGGSVHVPAFCASEDSKVIVLCGRNSEKTTTLTRKYDIPFAVTDYRELLKMNDIALVTITTPPQLHYPMVIDAIKAGKHVLCEKPMAVTVREAYSLYNTVRDSSVIHALGHQMRFHPSRKTIKNILEQGDLGRIINVALTLNVSSRIDQSVPWSWWDDANAGGGALFALGSHQIDILRWWFGDVDYVMGDLKTYNQKRRNPDTDKMCNVTADEIAAFQLCFESGTLASVVVSSVAIGWRGISIQIYGEKGSLFLDGEDSLTMFRKTTATHNLSFKDPLLTEGWISGSAWRVSFARMACSLINAIKTNQAYTGSTFYDGLKTQEIMEAIWLSNKEKRRVEIREFNNNE